MTANILHWKTNTCSYKNVSHVYIIDGEKLVTFVPEVLPGSLLVLNLDPTALLSFRCVPINCGAYRPLPMAPNLPIRAQAIIEAAGRDCEEDPPVFQFATRPAQADPGDPGDEGPMDQEVQSPFSQTETILIHAELTKVWQRFALAQQMSFKMRLENDL